MKTWRPKSIFATSTVALLTLLTLSVLVIACTPKQAEDFAKTFGQSVKVVPGDTTAPVVTLTIPDLGSGQTVLHTGDPPVSYHVNSVNLKGFLVVGAAEDPQGVQSVCVQASGGRECTCGGIGQREFPTYAPQCLTMTVQADGTATTRVWIPFPVDLTTVRACDPGCQGGSTFTLVATGKNFSGLQASTSPVTFTNP